MRYNTVNNNEDRKGVDLEEASGTQDMDTRTGGNDGDSMDPWRSSLEGFNPDSTPDSRLYDGTNTKVSIFNISAAGNTMTVDIDFGGDSYEVFLDTFSPIMEADPGETIIYNINVGTRSAVGDTLDLSLAGTHVSWGHLDVSYHTLTLGPKGYSSVTLLVTPPPGTPMGVQGEVILKVVSRTAGPPGSTLETYTIVKQLHLLEAEPSSRTVHVEPGVAKHLDITVTNNGNGLENLTFSLDADRGYWGSISPSTVSVDVGESINVRVTFSLPQGVLAGEEEPFDLVLFSEVEGGGFEGGETTSLVPTLHIPIQMVVAEIVSLRWGNIQDANVLPGESLQYELTLYNEGNSNSTVLLGYQGPDGWLLEIENGDGFTIPAFAAWTFNATLTAPVGVDAGTTVRLDISAGVGAMFFYTQMRVTMDHLYVVEVDGHEAKFADQNFVNLGTKDDKRSAQVHVFMTSPGTAEAFEEKTLTINFVSENDAVTATHLITLTVNPISAFEVETEVMTDSIDVKNSAQRTATYLIHVRNTGNQEDLFHIGLLDLPARWPSIFESRMLSVPANKRRTVEFSIAPPGGDAPTLAGTFTFKVHVASELDHGQPSVAPLAVTVLANRGHTISSLEPSYGAISGSELTFRVLVTNQGNVPETVTLSAVGSFESVFFESMELVLKPFGQRVVNVTVELPSTKEDTTVDLQIIATSKDLTKQVFTKVPVEVEGRTGVPGPAATAALMALGIAAVMTGAGTRRRRRG